MIKIRTKKILVRGEKRIEVTGLEALKKAELPQRYIYHPNSVRWDISLCTGKPVLSGSAIYVLKVGESYSPEKFEERIEEIKAAGELLRDINKQLAIENAGWEGEETYII